MNVGIIGAGTMGSGIAQAFAMQEGNCVFLCGIREASVARGLDRIRRNISYLVNKDKITAEEGESILGRIVTGTPDICKECDLIVESVPEDLDLKKQVFSQLMNIVPKDCLFASNTSSLSLSRIEEGLDRPVVGMHFFNPADRMKLVEVIRGKDTPEEMVNRVMEIASSIGKTPVQAKEYPGFVVNRILIPMINEAINVYAEGTATAENIDIAMQLGASHPMGPLHLADLIGLDICLAIMEVIYHETGDHKYAPCALLKRMVSEGKLGRKTGEGFFVY